MLAHLSGGRSNAAAPSRGPGVDATTVARHLDPLADLLPVRRLAPRRGNVSRRPVKSPEVYVRDAGLVHAPLDVSSRTDSHRARDGIEVMSPADLMREPVGSRAAG